MASVGAYCSNFGVPANGSANPVAGVAACPRAWNAASRDMDSAPTAIAVANATERLPRVDGAAIPAVLFMALPLVLMPPDPRNIGYAAPTLVAAGLPALGVSRARSRARREDVGDGSAAE